MTIPIYQVDAFTGTVFSGNPAAVCPLREWPEDSLLQAMAAENNLSETAFFIGGNGHYELRWFTPTTEVDLCGHATLAAAFIILIYFEESLAAVTFNTRSGPLKVERDGAMLVMDFPARPGSPCTAPQDLIDGLGVEPSEVLLARDYMAIYDSEDTIPSLEPNMECLLRLDGLGVIATAPGKKVDFVSRFFAPKAGVPEDPVTGSAHCTLVPYWSKRLNKKKLEARQLSKRGGELFCEDLGDRIKIAGRAVLYLEGMIHL